MSPLSVPHALTFFICIGNLPILKPTPMEISGYGDKKNLNNSNIKQ